jgi:hypothetical protein
MSDFDKNHRRTPESAANKLAELVFEEINQYLEYDKFGYLRIWNVADLGAGGGALSKALLRAYNVHVYAVDRHRYPGDAWPDAEALLTSWPFAEGQLTVCEADILLRHAEDPSGFAQKHLGVPAVHGVVMNPPFNMMAEFLDVACSLLKDPSTGRPLTSSLGIFALLPLRWMASKSRLEQLHSLRLTLEGISIFQERPSFLAFEDGAWVEGKSGAAEDFGVFHFMPSSERLATTGPAEPGQIRIL